MPALALGVNEAAIHAKPATFHKAADDPMGAAFRNLTARRVKAAQAIRSPYWDAAFRFGAAKSDRALVRLDTLPSLLTVRTFFRAGNLSGKGKVSSCQRPPPRSKSPKSS